MKHIIIVCESGWIIFGTQTGADKNTLSLSESSVVRRWNNGRGIGGLAKEKYKDEYTLDPIGDVEIMQSKILFKIPCEW